MNSHPSSSKSPSVILAWVAAAWATGILGYYLKTASKTFSGVPGFFDLSGFPDASLSTRWEVWKESLLILLGALGISWIVWGWGSRVADLLGLKTQPGLMRWALRFGMGVCFLNLFWMGTGLARLWFPALEWGGLGLLFIGLIPQTLDFFRPGIERIKNGITDRNQTSGLTELNRDKNGLNSPLKKKRFTLFTLCNSVVKDFLLEPLGFRIPPSLELGFLVFLGLLFTLLTFAQALTPESFYDSMVYHLAVPVYWLMHHGMIDFPTNFFSNYPYGGECFFLNGLALQGTETAKMLQALAVLACAFAAGGWAGEVAGEKCRWLAFGLTATLPLLTLNAWATQVDGILALFVVLFLYCLLKVGEGGKRWALAAGLLAGMALSVKYTALFALVPALGLLVFQKSFKRSFSFSDILIFSASASLLFLPWIIKNYSFTGNPVFPYLPDWFVGRHLSPTGYARLMEEQHAVSAHNIWQWLGLPWTLTFSNPDSYNFCGPLALGLIPLAFLIRSKHPTLRFLSRLCVLLLVAGLANTHILKFSLPVFPLFYVLAACLVGFQPDTRWHKGLSWAGVLAALLCLGPLLAIAQYYYPCLGVLTGVQTRDENLVSQGKITPYLPMARWMNHLHEASSSGVLIAGDARGLYYGRPFLSNTVFDDQFLSKVCRDGRDTEGLRLALKEAGVDYLAVNGPEGVRVSSQYHHYDLTSTQWRVLDDFIQRGTDLVYSRNLLAVYKIRGDWKEKPTLETPNLFMLFSKPASEFMRKSQEKDWDGALAALRETANLYSFSPFWQDQLKELKQKLGRPPHG